LRADRLDVQDGETVRRVVHRIAQEAGRIDVLVNNAGYGQLGAVEEVTDEEAWRQFDVNVFGVLRVTRAVLPMMRRQRSGRIINVSSMAAHLTLPFMGMYCASKHALRALSDALRRELTAWGIEVVQIEPGPVRTAFQENAFTSAGTANEDGASPYAPMSRAAEEKRGRGQQRWAVPVARVVDRIDHSIRATRPRARYPDATLSRWGVRLARFTPDRLLDRLLRRVSGL
jgi:NAD(P)-dependent dehydrogenase (short-subunit alcohol dehydrogenase family)